MSENWQVGDLALCVQRGRSDVDPTQIGCIYEVDKIFMHPKTSALCLGLRGVADFVKGKYWGHNSSRFRKVTPPKADEFDREVIELMTGRKVPSHA